MASISFPQWHSSTVVPDGISVSKACALAGHPLNLVCGGSGRCGKCFVDVEDSYGRRRLKACQTEVTPDMRIWLETEETLHILEHGAGDTVLGDASCPDTERYAAACDLGTTSVVLYLCDRKTGLLLGQWSALNGQSVLGADVVARLQAALEPGSQAELRRRVQETLATLLMRAEEETGVQTKSISALVVAGNSAMQHLLFGFPVEKLSRSPYRCHTEDTVLRSADEMDLPLTPGALVTFLPLIGSFIGGDTVAAMLATGWEEAEDICLLIDLGTNGELVLGNRNRHLAASAAAGPAMEGAGIVHGMRGTAGAVERVLFSEAGLTLQVIGGGTPIGLCGSGLVDLLAGLVACGAVSPQGRMAASEAYLADGGAEWVAGRLLDIDGQRAFLVAGEEETRGAPLLLYQSDVRAMQLAKGAIAAAACLLLDAYGLAGHQVSRVLLAGAFGNYIDVDSAQRIGLIPDFTGVPVCPVGNAAGVGARMYLLSEEKRQAAATLAKATEHVELAAHPDFAYIYAACMELCPLSEMDLDDLL